MVPEPKAAEFALGEGGIFHRILKATLPGRLRTAAAVSQRVAALALLAWLPLLALSAFEGRAWGGEVALPFLLDIEAHVRFLVALPLLVLAEVATQRRLPPLLREFLVRRLVPEESIPRFREAVASAMRLRKSWPAEGVILALVYGVGIFVVWRQYWALDTATWYATHTAGRSSPTLAGLWYGLVSVPIVQFLLLRWYWRIFVWARLLWQVSRIALQLVPAHPDRVGGLEFLGSTGYAFALLAMAHGALVAGPIASRIFFAGAELSQFANGIAVAVLFVLVMVDGPLFFFLPQLAQARHRVLREYGGLGERYVRAFEAKWLAPETPRDEPLVGTADIQSLADLGNAYGVAKGMRIVPITNESVMGLVMATLAPIAPLLLTMIPLAQLLKKLLKIDL